MRLREEKRALTQGLKWALAGLGVTVLAILAWLALRPEPEPAAQPVVSSLEKGGAAVPQVGEGRFVPCPDGTRPKPRQPHVCVSEEKAAR